MTRQVREKEEELDEQRVKSENLRQELRKADKAKREVRHDSVSCVTSCIVVLVTCLCELQLQTSLDEMQAEATKERKLRECNDVTIQKLEQELDKVKVRDRRAPQTANVEELQQEISK